MATDNFDGPWDSPLSDPWKPADQFGELAIVGPSVEDQLRALPYDYKDAYGLEHRYILQWDPPTSRWSAGYYAVGTAWHVSDFATLAEAVTHLRSFNTKL